jgi:ornithine carbamoyltransferase
MIQLTTDHNRANPRNDEEFRTEQDSSDQAKKQTEFTPCCHAIAGVVVTDDVFFGMVVLSYDRKLFHIEA